MDWEFFHRLRSPQLKKKTRSSFKRKEVIEEKKILKRKQKKLLKKQNTPNYVKTNDEIFLLHIQPIFFGTKSNALY